MSQIRSSVQMLRLPVQQRNNRVVKAQDEASSHVGFAKFLWWKTGAELLTQVLISCVNSSNKGRNREQREEDLQRSKLQQPRIVWVASLLIH